MKILLLGLALVCVASAQFGNAVRLQNKPIKPGLSCSDGQVVTWVAANNEFECAAGSAGGIPVTGTPSAGWEIVADSPTTASWHEVIAANGTCTMTAATSCTITGLTGVAAKAAYSCYDNSGSLVPLIPNDFIGTTADTLVINFSAAQTGYCNASTGVGATGSTGATGAAGAAGPISATGGSGTELQYRAGATTLGGMAGSAWDDTARTLEFFDTNNNSMFRLTANPAGDANSQLLIINDPSAHAVSVSSGDGTQGGYVSFFSGGGGNTTDAANSTGGVGGEIQLIASSGGTANAATGTGTGGAGGDIFVLSGGGAVGGTTAANSFGGAGGQWFQGSNAGGDAAGTANGLGGAGGAFTLVSGNGGNATGTGINSGGAGASMTITAGHGGNTSGGSSNSGGNGGDIQFNPGIAGTGSDADGVAGKVVVNGAFASELGTCTAATLAAILTATRDMCYCTDCKVTTVAANVVSNATCTGTGAGALAINVGGTAKCTYLP